MTAPAARSRDGRVVPAPDPTSSWLVPTAHVVLLIEVVTILVILLQGNDRVGSRALGASIAQASGLAALAWAYVSLLLGLAVSIRPPGRGRPKLTWRPGVVALHRQLSVAVVALSLVHAFTWALETPAGSLLVALVPQTAPTQRLGYTFGVLALYLAIVLGPTYYLRDRIGRRTWLVAHQLSAFTYALGLWHALALGMDLRVDGALRTVTWILQLPLLAVLALRLQRPLRRSEELDPIRRGGRWNHGRHLTSRTVLVVAIGGTLAIVLVLTLLAMGSAQHGTTLLGLPRPPLPALHP